MTSLIQEIQSKARMLSVVERERLAQRLLTSMEDDPLTDVEEAWIAEAERRLDDWRSGRTKGLNAKETLDDIRAALRP